MKSSKKKIDVKYEVNIVDLCGRKFCDGHNILVLSALERNLSVFRKVYFLHWNEEKKNQYGVAFTKLSSV